MTIPSQDQATELARQLFDLAAVVYRADPSDTNFGALVEKAPEHDDRASLTEVAYEVARARGFGVPVIGHLAKALAVEHRLHEAQHFCERWVVQEPANQDGHRLAAMLACQRMDLARAQTALDALTDLGTIRAIKTVMFLAFTDGREATITARQALGSTPPDSLSPTLAAATAYRQDDAQLLVDALGADPGLCGDRHREALAKKMLRTLLVELLAWKGGNAT